MEDGTGEKIGGWGNFPVEHCHLERPRSIATNRRAALEGEQRSYIARGLGRAYGDAALNRDGGVILQTGLNRFLQFDEDQGILHCEAGVSLGEIIEVVLPKGWFLPTTPGTKFVTVGGAIAADVHGKNHHRDGSWGDFVLDFELLTASGETLFCSSSQHSDVYWATIGGMGLTGIILSARIQLIRVETAYYDVDYRRLPNLDALLDCLTETDNQFRYSVAWIDCLASGKSLGRSVAMLGNDAAAQDLEPGLRRTPFFVRPKRQKNVPFHAPNGALNSHTAKLFNAFFYARHAEGRKIVDYDTYFYPLDSIQHWNRVYGRRGFIQYQAHFPLQSSRRGLLELLEAISNSGNASFLAVLKSSGPGNRGLLSYLRPGHTLALDMPNTGESLLRLTKELDEILLKHDGRVYLAKDATTSAGAFHSMYDRLGEFQAIKRKVDPNTRFCSSQARRLRIVDIDE